MTSLPKNRFKQRLLDGTPQIGLFMALANGYTAEIAAEADFDWLMIDFEHGPNDLRSILSQLQALAGRAMPALVRPPVGEMWMIKQLLDIGAQTLLVPMVETPEQAAAIVSYVHYPPRGIRGVGATLARASRWNGVTDYLRNAADELCLVLQIETKAGVDNIEAIAVVPGVDALFIGPSDLAADLGHIGQPSHSEVRAVLDEAIRRGLATGKPIGIYAADVPGFERARAMGCRFVAVGSDVAALAGATRSMAAQFRALLSE